MNRCRYPKARECSCDSSHAESLNVRRMRNDALYRNTVNPDAKVNSLVAWMNSDRWHATPSFPHVRGNVIIKCLTHMRSVSKIVANGAVSGETPWK